jgi:phosphatidylserine decarboxylase
MQHVFYVDRKLKKVEQEPIYGQFFIEILYGSGRFTRIFSKVLLWMFTKNGVFSRLYGCLQKCSCTRKKIPNFIATYHIDMTEAVIPEGGFVSFNDFFIRRLIPESRPLVCGDSRLALPADGRYLVFPRITEEMSFFVKGQKFSLVELVQDKELADQYIEGSAVFARLCPTDYHRFHFPCDCMPGSAKLIQGKLASVNPIALRQYLHILWENKRMLTKLETKSFGDILYIEVGATAVGSICQTYQSGVSYAKGSEKGYFEFGGSCVLMLFQKNRVIFDEDLIKASSQRLETKANMGESLGRSV